MGSPEAFSHSGSCGGSNSGRTSANQSHPTSASGSVSATATMMGGGSNNEANAFSGGGVRIVSAASYSSLTPSPAVSFLSSLAESTANQAPRKQFHIFSFGC